MCSHCEHVIRQARHVDALAWGKYMCQQIGSVGAACVLVFRRHNMKKNPELVFNLLYLLMQ